MRAVPYRCRLNILAKNFLHNNAIISVYKQLGDLSPRRCVVGELPFGEVPVGGKYKLGKCQLEDLNLSDFLGQIFYV